MSFENGFIRATLEYNTFDSPVPAYYFRRRFALEEGVKAVVKIAVCGFYELYLNGERITRGMLSPYISNPEHYVYYDEYEVELLRGENVVGVLLGNGFQNNPGGYVWDFDKASFRSAPCFSLAVLCGERVILESDESFRIFSSPIRSDDYRFGEYYDARYETRGWASLGFDDSSWSHAISAPAPKGTLRKANIAPITKEKELYPVEIIKSGDGFIYDFGESNAGVCRLKIRGERGQKIELRHADSLKDGDLNTEGVWFTRFNWERDKSIVHRDTYVLSGEGEEEYQPTFTYHGFRYVRVDGIKESQATEELLTYLVYHTELSPRGDFSCSDPVANRLQEMTRRSIKSNFHHFPTDCPQREKNGWTADAALTSETSLLNFDPEKNFSEWIANVRRAQREDGSLPGIVPTAGWGYHWGNGPAWDSALVYLPYYTYVYRGSTDMIEESREAFITYLKYLRSRADGRGLLEIGLGDWCHVGGIEPKAPLVLTDTVISMDLARKISVMLEAMGDENGAAFARAEYESYKASAREKLIDPKTLTALGGCQTSQAMCLYYGVFEPQEREAAFSVLLELIHGSDDHIDLGVLGGRVIFHVLSDFGYGELAFKMITREDYPSFGNWIARGATTLWEDFLPDGVSSMNHHFWGDISAWFIKRLAGINLNPSERDIRTVEIRPDFIPSLSSASAYHISPCGRISSSWERVGDRVILRAEIPKAMKARLVLPRGYNVVNPLSADGLVSGTYEIAFDA